MAINLSNISLGTTPNKKYYRAVATQDGSVAAQSVYCGFVPAYVAIYRTDTAGNTIQAVLTSPDGAASPTMKTFQTVAAGTTTILSTGLTPLTGAEAAPAAAAAGQPSQPSQSAGFTIGTDALTASSTLLIIAEA